MQFPKKKWLARSTAATASGIIRFQGRSGVLPRLKRQRGLGSEREVARCLPVGCSIREITFRGSPGVGRGIERLSAYGDRLEARPKQRGMAAREPALAKQQHARLTSSTNTGTQGRALAPSQSRADPHGRCLVQQHAPFRRGQLSVAHERRLAPRAAQRCRGHFSSCADAIRMISNLNPCSMIVCFLLLV